MEKYDCFGVIEDGLVVVFCLESLVTFLFPITSGVLLAVVVGTGLLFFFDILFRDVEFTAGIFEHWIEAFVFVLLFASHSLINITLILNQSNNKIVFQIITANC